MPNWCENRVMISADKEEDMKEFKDKAFKKDKDRIIKNEKKRFGTSPPVIIWDGTMEEQNAR